MFVALEGQMGIEDAESLRSMQDTVGEAFGQTLIVFSGNVVRQRSEFVGIRIGVY